LHDDLTLQLTKLHFAAASTQLFLDLSQPTHPPHTHTPVIQLQKVKKSKINAGESKAQFFFLLLRWAGIKIFFFFFFALCGLSLGS
jgi:hypothetical protein